MKIESNHAAPTYGVPYTTSCEGAELVNLPFMVVDCGGGGGVWVRSFVVTSRQRGGVWVKHETPHLPYPTQRMSQTQARGRLGLWPFTFTEIYFSLGLSSSLVNCKTAKVGCKAGGPETPR